MSMALLCTVGGSHEPILHAIKSVAPEHVCFFCTEEDPQTGQRGSDVQVVGQGKVIKAKPRDEKPTLPNIPTQAQLPEGSFECRAVPADDLDGAVEEMRTAFADLREARPGVRLVADYTSGTKTMTAALALAALEFDDVELQLVAGARPNLERTPEGTEQARRASVDALRLRRTMSHHLDSWRRFSYYEAVEGLETIRAPTGAPGAKQLPFAKSMSRALALWDRFDHDGAWRLIDIYRAKVRTLYPELVQNLKLLTKDGAKRDPARLFDLWLNAQRRASQGRFDDAVARWYRLLEWTAQWQIRVQLDLETKDFPIDRLPESVGKPTDGQRTVNVGLMDAWKIIAADCTGPCQEFASNEASKLRSHADKRNNSILAHGSGPVSESDWRELANWTNDAFLPMLGKHAAKVGINKELVQLPTQPPVF